MSDPISVISLALGAASLAIQVFDGVKKGYEYFEVAVEMPERYASLRLRLQIEFGRLLDWGDAAGLTENEEIFDKKMRVNGAMVMAVLSEMQSLLKNMRQLSLSYENALRPMPESAKMPRRRQPVDSVNLKEFRAMFESPDVQKERRKFPKGFNRLIDFASGVKLVGKQPLKRVRWAMRDEEKFKEMLQRLTPLTNYLHETLGDDKMKILVENTRDSCLAVLQLTKDLGQIKALLEATRMAPLGHLGAAVDDSISIFSQAETLVDEVEDRDVDRQITKVETQNGTVFQRLVEFRAVNTQLYGLQAKAPIRVPVIHSNELLNLNYTDQGSRAVAMYGKKNVWIEWKPYETGFVNTPDGLLDEGIPENVQRNAECLVALLRAKEKPVEFCVPFCLGYVNNTERKMFGFVYEAPDADVKPTSLLQLFSSRPAPIKQRIALAQRLATCLLYLHAVNWLHKSLRSASILFFSQTKPDLWRPFLSSFEYSRPDVNSETFTGAPVTPEWVLYCHPDYIGRPDNFRKSYDIYSLGIILLEIAFWKPVEEIFDSEHSLDRAESTEPAPTNNKNQTQRQVPKVNEIRREMMKNRERLLHDEEVDGKPGLLATVRDTMGDRYHNAVRACIGGMEYFRLPTNVDQTDPIIAALLQQAYLRLVVDSLDGIIV